MIETKKRTGKKHLKAMYDSPDRKRLEGAGLNVTGNIESDRLLPYYDKNKFTI